MKQGAQKAWDHPITLREGLNPPRPQLRHGPYVVVRLLGRGGMAVVHVVRRAPDDGERFAMKRILPELANLRPFARSFENEARLGERLVHPNIVRVVDFGEQDGELALVTEYIDGTSCARLLSAASRAGGGLPLRARAHSCCDGRLGSPALHRSPRRVTGEHPHRRDG
jgi:serine/threonine-protein kinase